MNNSNHKKVRCCICGKVIDGPGNNPEPVAPYYNKCCDYCNENVVVPERIAQIMGE